MTVLWGSSRGRTSQSYAGSRYQYQANATGSTSASASYGRPLAARRLCMLLCSDCSVCVRAWLPSILTGNEFAKKPCTRASSSRRCIHGWMGKGCVSRGVYARMWCFRLQCNNMPPVSRKVQAYKALLGWRATVVMAVGMGGELRAAGWEEYRTLAFARLCIGPCCYLPPAVVAARARRPTRQRAAGHALGLRDQCRTRKRYPFSQRSPGLAASMCSSTLLDRSPTRVPTHVDAYPPAPIWPFSQVRLAVSAWSRMARDGGDNGAEPLAHCGESAQQ